MSGTALALILLLVPQQAESGEVSINLDVEETVLDNGMRVLIAPRRQVPRVYCSLWWRVGSVNERPGITGLSHFFEHMMFMGTDRIGTTDPARDRELNAKIEKVMEEVRLIKLGRLEAKRRGEEPPAGGEARYGELMKEYQALVDEQKKIIYPEHISKIYQGNGGTGLNASTSYDRTNYFIELPSNKVELFFWLESDRFGNPVFRSFYPERDVIKEERRRRTESTPTGLIRESYLATFWQAHPYSWPVLGWMSDIDQYRVADARRYYDTYYSPDNATAIFVGDVDSARILELARKYFGRLKRFEGERPPVVTQEPEQKAERRIEAEAEARSEITVRWHGPSGVHRETAYCDLLMNAFEGRTGRLYRPLVEDKKLALDVGAWYWSLRYGGVLNLNLTPREGVDFAEAEKELYRIVEEVREHGITARELEKLKNSMLADLVRRMKTYRGITYQLGYFETIGTHRDLHDYVRTLKSATMGDVKRVAQKYLIPEGRNVLIIRRKGADK